MKLLVCALCRDAVALQPYERSCEHEIGRRFTCAACVAEREKREAAERKYALASRLVNRLPLCQDHRDKFPPGACQACRAEHAERQRDALVAACRAAERYDEAIQRHASKGESWVEGDDLDALYEDWITKTRAALKLATEGT